MRSGRATILALDTRRVPALLQKTRLVDDQNRIWTAQLFHNVMAQLIPRSVCIPTSPVQQMLHPIGAASSIHSANCQPFLRSQPLNKPCKYARLSARGSERTNTSAIKPCARNNSRFQPDNRFSMAKNEELHPRANSVYHLSTTVVLGLLQHVAGVCLEHQPHGRSGLQTQRAAGAGRQVDDELSATIDFGDHRDVLLTQRYDAPRNYVSCAQVTWPRGRHKNVSRANANLHRVPGSHSS